MVNRYEVGNEYQVVVPPKHRALEKSYKNPEEPNDHQGCSDQKVETPPERSEYSSQLIWPQAKNGTLKHLRSSTRTF